MFDNLRTHGLDVSKLSIFDGSIDRIQIQQYGQFDLTLIDGEHTDEAAFRDFLHAMKLMNDDSAVIFHDSSLVFKAIKLVLLLLQSDAKAFQFVKQADSEMACILLGSLASLYSSACGNKLESPDTFFARAERYVLVQKIRNLTTLSVTFRPPQTQKGY